jgi:hypothetical protein
MRIASSRERAIANRSVNARTKTQTTWEDKKRVCGSRPEKLPSFNVTGGCSGACITVDMDFLTKGGFKLLLRRQDNYGGGKNIAGRYASVGDVLGFRNS